ncbi:MAG: hypothetical protein U1C55_10640, partial [Smithellaceae bacterium]|nr:hypothetical protein [Smithellaceae bacterium]
MARTYHTAAVLTALLLFFAIFVCGSCREAAAYESSIVSIRVNTENKGDFIVYLDRDGDFWVKEDHLSTAGIINHGGVKQRINSETFVSLKSIKGLKFSLDEQNHALDIEASPQLLRLNALDFSRRRDRTAVYQEDKSAFLNYGISLSGDKENDIRHGLTTELGARIGKTLFLSNFTQSPSSGFLRHMSNLSYENPENLLSLVAGDAYASSGASGSTVNMGGLSFFKNYDLNPYYAKQPSLDYKGYVTLPSDVEIYLNDVLIRQEKLSPGRFELNS